MLAGYASMMTADLNIQARAGLPTTSVMRDTPIADIPESLAWIARMAASRRYPIRRAVADGKTPLWSVADEVSSPRPRITPRCASRNGAGGGGVYAASSTREFKHGAF